MFAKRRVDAPPGFFAVEAAGLAWLAEVEDRGGVHVVRAIEVADDRLVLPRLEEVSPTASAAEELGRALTVTHGAGAAAFGSPPDGWDGDGYIGPITLPHGSFERWGEFYARCRLEPFARAALERRSLSPDDGTAVERIGGRLMDGEWDDGRPPARLHGDLWNGNILWTAEGAVLVDPAAHGGHAETDLAMLALFGLPHLARVLAAYDEAAPLADGWRDRVALHQLHPLLVHATLFGGGYGAQAGAIARRYA